ncbi:uncharacterized protein [Malus domestica]|uniref:uncharacterized protein n=1 Tax=Malus domestica TaxID=3750 RepID=UPI0039758BA2
MADALATLASSTTLGEDEVADVPVCQRWVIPLITEMILDDINVISVLPVDTEEWRHHSEICRMAPRFLYYKETLYRCSFEGVLLRCLGEEEANQAMEEAHSGVCRAHQSGPKLHFQLKRMGYYWPSLGLDVVGLITPKSSAGEAYILVAIDYYSKWVEAIPLREVKKETVVRFIKEHIIHQYSVPRYIITDNGKQFSNRLMDEFCEKYKFKQHKSSMYHALANSLAEAFNKTLCNLLKKVIGRTKRD